MQVITAVEAIDVLGKPTAFLAGGITNCPWWQDEVIKILEPHDNGVLLNPRRRNFPIDDPNASREQITWEFNALDRANVFSMWFSDADSDQPICMLELGKHLERRATRNQLDLVVIGVEPGYRREQDVRIQSELVSMDVADRITDNLEDHAAEILAALEKVNTESKNAFSW